MRACPTEPTAAFAWSTGDAIDWLDLDGWPVIYAVVLTPTDQAALHRTLATRGYCPVHLATFERIGIWDEQFVDCYGEDADIAYRAGLAASEDGIAATNWWTVVDPDAWIMMQGYSAHMGGMVYDQAVTWQRYLAKWGGRSGHERWNHPYGRDLPLSYVGPPPA